MNNAIEIKKIYIGKIDAREEVASEGLNNFIESFVVPPKFDVNEFIKGDKYFIRGYKGTGKTALMFNIDNYAKSIDKSTCSSFMFFKSNFKAHDKVKLEKISKNIINSYDIDLGVEELEDAYDFEYIWKWIFYQRIIDDNEEFNEGLFEDDEEWKLFKKSIEKISFDGKNKTNFKFPKVVQLVPSFKQEINGSATFSIPIVLDFKSENTYDEYSLFIDIIDEATRHLSLLKRSVVPYYIFVDELEAYYSDERILKRD